MRFNFYQYATDTVIMNYVRVFLALITVMTTASSRAYDVKISLGVGRESIATLIKSQDENLFVRASLTKEFLELTKAKINLGFEIAARTGFTGSITTSEAVQDAIGGPQPIAISGPRIEVLAIARKYINNSKVFVLSKLGMDFSTINFDRCDFHNSTAINFIGYMGVGLELNQKYEINMTVGSSRPMSNLTLPGPGAYFMQNPYTQIAAVISFGYMF